MFRQKEEVSGQWRWLLTKSSWMVLSNPYLMKSCALFKTVLKSRLKSQWFIAKGKDSTFCGSYGRHPWPLTVCRIILNTRLCARAKNRISFWMKPGNRFLRHPGNRVRSMPSMSEQEPTLLSYTTNPWQAGHMPTPLNAVQKLTELRKSDGCWRMYIRIQLKHVWFQIIWYSCPLIFIRGFSAWQGKHVGSPSWYTPYAQAWQLA